MRVDSLKQKKVHKTKKRRRVERRRGRLATFREFKKKISKISLSSGPKKEQKTPPSQYKTLPPSSLQLYIYTYILSAARVRRLESSERQRERERERKCKPLRARAKRDTESEFHWS